MRKRPAKLHRVTVQIPESTLAELEREARRARISLSKAALEVIQRGLRVATELELQRRLREGYEALADEHRSLAREMDAVRRLDD